MTAKVSSTKVQIFMRVVRIRVAVVDEQLVRSGAE
jgi:hypothetical protein